MDLIDKVRRGLSLKGIDIIDVHAHIGEGRGHFIVGAREDELIKTMDLIGIKMIFVSSNAAIFADEEFGNEIAIKAAARYPEKIKAYVVLNPNYPERMRAELEKYLKKGNVAGIKIHPDLQSYPLNGKGYEKVWELALEYDLIVLTHSWGGSPYADPKLLEAVLKKYNGIRVILGHAGGVFEGFSTVVEMLKKYENLFIDICGSIPNSLGVIEYFVKHIDNDRILFASDMPWIDPSALLGNVVFADIKDEVKFKIFALNAKRIFGIMLGEDKI